MDVEYRTIGISQLEMNAGQVEGLPSNPRQWTREELDSLKKSLRETPELFHARGCIVAPHGGKFIVLGGNMRLAAATELGDSEVPCMVLPEGLPVQKMKEIVVKDNGSFGSWDMDALANEWDDLPLKDWGVDMSFGDVPAIADEPLQGEEAPEESDPSSQVMVFSVSLFGKSGDAVLCDRLNPELAEKLLGVILSSGGAHSLIGSRNSLRLMIYNITERVAELHRYYDEMLDAKIARIAELAGVGTDAFVKLNPADFIARNRFQRIDGYDYRDIGRWIAETKRDGVYLISPLDADEETANQISYKEGHIEKKLRASKCDIVPLHKRQALSFFVKNHRQSLPPISERGVSFGLVYDGCLVSVMTYDVQTGAVRGRKTHYELLRLAIRHGYRVNGGASRLQKHCEDALSAMGETEVFSYSNATINNGAVYRQLGFSQKKAEGGQPFVMMRDNSLVRLITLYPDSTDSRLARAGRIKTHIGGNRLWTKKIGSAE